MELALLVWLVSLLTSLDNFAQVAFAVGVTFTLLCGLLLLVVPEKEWNNEIRVNCKNYLFIPKTTLCLFLVTWIIPSEKTIQYMAGAYLLQSVYQSDIVNKAAPLAEKAILNQLKSWAKDNPEVENLIQNTVEVK
jgi:hypothetical protein